MFKRIIFVLITLVVTLVVVPIAFNFLFLWESGWSKGKTSDWFTLYGNIIGGLIGGFFTYLALLLTINDQKKSKQEEMRPRIDIPHQTIEFEDTGEEINDKQLAIELNNVGGSLAKNIECSLSLVNLNETVEELKKVKSSLKVNLLDVTDRRINKKGINMIVLDKDGNHKASLGNLYSEYVYTEFIGNCMPLVLNHEAKSIYFLNIHISRWLNYIAQNRFYTEGWYNKNEIINFKLKVKYSSEYGDFCDNFDFEWKHIGIRNEDSKAKFNYVLKSKKQ
ncbi:hypothetical protein [Lysinibacillus xylanilyticus]|uniref:hypothetical protein n=1 Tax=Lysinibacillus xylanilyticus TaxID=582475 RepID=UPI003CFE26ED